MFMYNPISQEQAEQERFQLLPPGEYDAIIAQSEDKVSASSGNPMMDISLHVYDENGVAHSVRDFLVFTKPMMWKVIQFSNSAGLLKEYESGNLCSVVALDHNVRVKITVEEGNDIPIDKLKGKPEGSKYPSKNKIEAYIKRDANSMSSNQEHDPFQDDDIPFL